MAGESEHESPCCFCMLCMLPENQAAHSGRLPGTTCEDTWASFSSKDIPACHLSRQRNSELAAGCSPLTDPVHHVSPSLNISTLAHEPVSGVTTSGTGASIPKIFMLKGATHLSR